MGIKENWELIDGKCEICGQTTVRAKGITRQNMKRLFVPKWNATEMTINVLLLGIVLMAFLYNTETSQAREYVKLVESGELCGQIDLATAGLTSRSNALGYNLNLSLNGEANNTHDLPGSP